MSGVYIPGMEMPDKKNGAVLIVYPDGKAIFEDGTKYTAVPVPEHGRLIDADEACRRFPVDADPRNGYMLYKLNNELPTIIPADPAEEGKG